MLLEKLRDRALADPDLPPPGYQRQPIRYIIRLTADGAYINMEDTADSGSQKRGTQRLAPHVKRTVGVMPKLLADTGEYVLGIARNDPHKPANSERVARQRTAFVELVNDCAETTGEPNVRAVARFLDGNGVPDADLGESFDPSATITFRINDPSVPEGVLPIDLPSVRAFWARRAGPEDGDDGAMTCIVCGTHGPVLERHPLKIKGIPGGQIQKDLISANAPAFESYGLNASQIAPTCAACAEAYGNALNALLASKSTSIWTKELAYAFWTEDPANDFGETVVGFLTEPAAHESQIRHLLTALYSGKTESLALDPTRFYTVALGASGARVVVRDWIDTTIGETQKRFARYFAAQELVQWDGAPGTPLPLSWLTNATVHRKSTPPPIVSRSLTRMAIAGTPLPLDVLYLAVRRNRAEQAVSRERAMLIKMTLTSRAHASDREIFQMSALDPNDVRPAYLCGRLLAVLDNIQYRAIKSRNTTIVSRYYGTASSAPATVFGTLMHGARNHLSTLERDQRGAWFGLEKQLEDITIGLPSFPMTLTLEEQGLFALGFYHQRAADRKAASDAKAKSGASSGKPVNDGNVIANEPSA